MSLSMAKPGQVVRLRAILAGHCLQGRLAALGLIPGVELKIIRTGSHGPLVVEVKGSRLMLGRGMARQIEVEAVA
ncbi:MAG: FeoA family protein [Planctomycetota bacterium]